MVFQELIQPPASFCLLFFFFFSSVVKFELFQLLQTTSASTLLQLSFSLTKKLRVFCFFNLHFVSLECGSSELSSSTFVRCVTCISLSRTPVSGPPPLALVKPSLRSRARQCRHQAALTAGHRLRPLRVSLHRGAHHRPRWRPTRRTTLRTWSSGVWRRQGSWPSVQSGWHSSSRRWPLPAKKVQPTREAGPRVRAPAATCA